MQIGPYTIRAIHAGGMHLDGGAMFGIVPRALWQRRIEPDERGRIPMALRCLLIEGKGRRILIDTGVGTKIDSKFADIYGIDHESSNLMGSLENAGVQPDDITDLILTHLHFDHAGGATHRNEDGELVLSFPDARIHLQSRQLDWAKESPREQASFLGENIDPLVESGKLNVLDGPGELFPGIEIIVVDGHTRGQQLVRIHHEDESLLFAADLFPTSHHVPDLWVMAYDIAPLDSLEEKRAIGRRAAEEGWTIFFEHDANVVLGRIELTDRGLTLVDTRTELA